MKKLVLWLALGLTFALPLRSLRAGEDYQFIHNLAHLGAGEIIAVPTAAFLNASGFSRQHPVWAGFIVVGLPALVGYLKENDDYEHGGIFNYGEWASTALSGVMVETVVLTWH